MLGSAISIDIILGSLYLFIYLFIIYLYLNIGMFLFRAGNGHYASFRGHRGHYKSILQLYLLVQMCKSQNSKIEMSS